LLTEPYRQRAVAGLLAEIKALQEQAAEQVDRWQRALISVDEGIRVAGTGAVREAISHFELALRTEPASRRASAEADRGRDTLAAQRAIDQRAQALLDEARKAAAAKQWQAAIVLCNDALLLDSRVAAAAELKRTAVAAIEAEARERKLECERALGRAEAFRRKGRFQEATQEIARARELDPTAEIDAVEGRIRTSIAEAEREALQGQQAAEAITAARNAFAAGRRDEALAELKSFHASTPHPLAATEITRLESEAKRLAVAEQRAAEAAEHAKSAEAALTGGKPEQALELANRALAIDPGHVLARKVSGLAAAEVKQREEAKARAAKATRHIEDAKEQLARGKFQKARELVFAAAELTPSDKEHKRMLARIQAEETRVAAEAERQRVAKQRAKAVAPILEQAREADSRKDSERAAWLAENALAVDPDCSEAQQILRKARAEITANPASADETVDLTDPTGRKGDPDDTVSLMRTPTVWERLTGAVRKWSQGGRTGASDKGEAASRERAKT